MAVIDISNKPYNAFILVNCDDAYKDELIAALDFIWSKPEGKEKIEQTFRKGKLRLSCSYREPSCAYGWSESLGEKPSEELHPETPLAHHLMLNPELIAPRRYQTPDGEWEKYSLVSVLAHELYHAADENMKNSLETYAYSLRTQWKQGFIGLSELQDSARLFTEMLGSDYYSLNEDEKLARIERLYDEPESHQRIRELYSELARKNQEMFVTDPQIAQYVSKIETPAIEFANRIMNGIEPPRKGDYSDEMDVSKYLDVLIEKDTFIAFVQSKMNGIEIFYDGNIDNFCKEMENMTQPSLNDLAPGALVHTPQVQGKVAINAIQAGRQY
jgi:hypothetical protein